MINSLFDCCLTVETFLYDNKQRKPYIGGLLKKYLLHRCLIDEVKI